MCSDVCGCCVRVFFCVFSMYYFSTLFIGFCGSLNLLSSLVSIVCKFVVFAIIAISFTLDVSYKCTFYYANYMTTMPVPQYLLYALYIRVTRQSGVFYDVIFLL